MLDIRWKLPPKRIQIMDEDVHIWQIPLDCPKNVSVLQNSILSRNEKKRSSSFHFDHDRRRFINAHIALRMILANYLHTDPRLIKYQFNSFGKPSLILSKKVNISFNMSHSNELALIAITNNHPIGIDIEFIRPLEDLETLAKQCLSVAEYQQFLSVPAPEKVSVFYNVWTRKEAFIKAIGDGLTYPLNKFDVSLLPNEPAKIKSIHDASQETKNWILEEIDTQAGYVASLAVKSERINIQQWIYQHENTQTLSH